METTDYVKKSHMEEIKNDMEKIIESLNVKLSEVENQRKAAANEVAQFKTMFHEKVDMKDIKNLELKI